MAEAQKQQRRKHNSRKGRSDSAETILEDEGFPHIEIHPNSAKFM